ncbi:maleylacetoacetate isomerase [Rhodoligotrophos appendicifer]|uniref:maleylacetoacetate isomerase n=1 Tax=Rhodoligotrophos appendicifer TaxID=987056 RepID=UPI001186056C|nr:maleylacetoacetate isomerase [Rhodoligotrophos appendicifer]
MKLYDSIISSAAYRLRIGLALKGLHPDRFAVELIKDGGEHRDAAFLAINPQGLVPALALEDGRILTQSLAVLEYLEERYPEPPLLPRGSRERAQVRAIAQMICSDIHPLTSLRLVKRLETQFGADSSAILAWRQHWISIGFEAVEQMAGFDGHCFGGHTTLADVCLVPQVVSARRYNIDLSAFPRINKIADVCGSLPVFAMTHPDRAET